MRIPYYPFHRFCSILGVFVIIWGMSACKSVKENPSKFGVRNGLIADSAMVVSAHPLASKIGREVLQKGGNAVDAMVAVHFSLAVVFPYAGNLGGGGFMVYRPANGPVETLDFREKAPKSVHRDVYLDENGEVVEGMSSQTIFSVGVPGSVAGMEQAYARMGSLPWAELLQPAIDLAQEGYIVTATQAKWLNKYEQEFIERNPDHNYFARSGGWKAGDTLIQKDLAETLTRIRDHKRDGFYAGPTAELLLAEHQRRNGWITQADLDAYQPHWRAPVKGKYRGYQIYSMPPPSSGGIALIQMLQMVEPYDLSALGWHTTESIHLMAEAERRAFADRSQHLGDPDFYPVPVTSLLDPAYNRSRMEGVTAEGKATPSTDIEPGKFAVQESEETTHYSIVDPFGNAVAVTTTLNSGYGSKIFVSDAGFLLNNEMDDFSAKPGTPNIYGLIGAEANAVGPEKRMLSSMTPTILEKDGQLSMVIGTPGGSTIITSVFQTVVNVVDHGMTLQESVDQPRFHHQWLPDKISYEQGAISPDVKTALEQKGHTCEERDAIGRIDAIRVLPDGKLEGAADPRRDDRADGF